MRRLRPEALGSLGIAFRVGAGSGRDEVGEHDHGLDVAALGDAAEAEGVERVAREQAQVGVHAGEGARLAVVEQVALVDRLDREQAIGIADDAREAIGARIGERVLRERGIERRGQVEQRAQRTTSRSASAAAASVRSTCSSVCASEGNHASNWDGGR